MAKGTMNCPMSEFFLVGWFGRDFGDFLCHVWRLSPYFVETFSVLCKDFVGSSYTITDMNSSRSHSFQFIDLPLNIWKLEANVRLRPTYIVDVAVNKQKNKWLFRLRLQYFHESWSTPSPAHLSYRTRPVKTKSLDWNSDCPSPVRWSPPIGPVFQSKCKSKTKNKNKSHVLITFRDIN